MKPPRPFPGHDAGAGGRAHRTSGVRIRAADRLRSEAVKVGRFVEAAPVAANVGTPQIIHQNKENVRRPGTGLCCSGERGRRQRLQEGTPIHGSTVYHRIALMSIRLQLLALFVDVL